MTNTIIDLIIRIKNGYMTKKELVEIPFSNFKEAVVKKLQQLGYIKKYTIEGEIIRKIIIELLYNNNSPAITDVKIFSKPGKRWYISYKDIKPVLGGLGCSIVSTSKGILTNKEVKKNKIGGELLFSLW